MRKNWSLLMSCAMALGMLFLWSCTNEETLLINDNGVPVEKGKLSFIIPVGDKRTVTYASPTSADVLQGLDDEYKIEDLWIYWFQDGASSTPETDILRGFFSLAGGTITMGANPTASSPTTTATITVGDKDFASKFYIVANVNGSSPVKADGLTIGNTAGQLMVNQTTRAEFEAVLANLLDDTSGDILTADNLQAPLPMSINKATSTNPGGGSGYITVGNPASTGMVDGIHLKRRVARFDILNNSDYSNFVITGVYVSKAQKTGKLHDFTGVASTTWAADSLGKFAVLDKANGGVLNLNGTRSIGVDTIDYSSGSAVNGAKDKIFDDFQLDKAEAAYKDSLERAKAVFYLYPTELAADGSKTEIMIEGMLYGQKRIYSLDLSDVKDVQGKVDIAANKLYTIRVKRSVSNQIVCKLTVDEWDNGVEIPAGGATAGVTDWGTATASTGETFDLTDATPDSYTYSSASNVTLTIVNRGTALNSNGDVSDISFSVVGVAGDDFLQSDYNLTATGANVSSDTPPATYGAVYTTTHTITLPPTNAPIEVEMKITNAGNPQESKVISLKSFNYEKKGKATVGTILDGSTLALGKGRLEKAYVSAVNGDGYPTQVYAIVGTLAEGTDMGSLPPTDQTVEEMREWLAATATFVTEPLKTALVNNAGKVVDITESAALQLKTSFGSDIKVGSTDSWYNMLFIENHNTWYSIVEKNGTYRNDYSLVNNLSPNLTSDVGIKVCAILNW